MLDPDYFVSALISKV